jgi:hypothetical protein
VDFVAVNLISCIVIIAGLLGVCDISLCSFGRAVFSDEEFKVIMCVLWFVVWFGCGLGMGMLGRGGGVRIFMYWFFAF